MSVDKFESDFHRIITTGIVLLLHIAAGFYFLFDLTSGRKRWESPGYFNVPSNN